MPRKHTFAFIFAFALGALIPLHGQDKKWSGKPSFATLVELYKKEKYTADGYISKTDQVVNGGLNSFGFASIVLHKMKYGEKWKDHYTHQFHQQAGAAMAKAMGLKKVDIAKGDVAYLYGSKSLVKGELKHKRLEANVLYFFDLKKGKHNHVGFIRIATDGSVSQTHFSDTPGYKGMSTGSFPQWLKASKYNGYGSVCTVYLVPE